MKKSREHFLGRDEPGDGFLTLGVPDRGHAVAIIGVGGFSRPGRNDSRGPVDRFAIAKENDKPKHVLDATKDMLRNAPKVEGQNYDKLFSRAIADPVVVYWQEEWIVEPTPAP